MCVAELDVGWMDHGLGGSNGFSQIRSAQIRSNPPNPWSIDLATQVRTLPRR